MGFAGWELTVVQKDSAEPVVADSTVGTPLAAPPAPAEADTSVANARAAYAVEAAFEVSTGVLALGPREPLLAPPAVVTLAALPSPAPCPVKIP